MQNETRTILNIELPICNLNFSIYSGVRNNYLRISNDVVNEVRKNFQYFQDIDSFCNNIQEYLRIFLSSALNEFVQRANEIYNVSNISEDEVFNVLIESSNPIWLEDSLDCLLATYIKKREDSKTSKEKFNFYRNEYIHSEEYATSIEGIFSKLAFGLHTIELNFAQYISDPFNPFSYEKIDMEIWDSDSRRIKSIKTISEIKKLDLSPSELRNHLKDAMGFYPYNPEIYVLWLAEFGDADNQLQDICERFNLTNLSEIKSNIINESIDNGVIETNIELFCLCEILGVPVDAQIVELGSALVNEVKTSQNTTSSQPKLETFNSIASTLESALDNESEGENSNLENTKTPGSSAACGSNQANDSESIDLEDVVRGFASDPDNKFYAAPNLPSKKVKKFLAKYRYEIGDDVILFYFDDSFFGGGGIGVLVDSSSVNINVPNCKNRYVMFHQISGMAIKGFLTKTIILKLFNGEKVSFELSNSNKGASMLYKAIQRAVNIIA